MTFDEIKIQIQQKKYAPIYLLQGEEAFFIDQLADELESKVLNENERSFNQTILYGKDTDADTIMHTARRYPMMAPYQVVMVKEAQQLRDITKLELYAKNPMKTTILVLLYKYKNLRGNTKVAKEIKKNGVIFTSKKLYEREVPPWIERYIRQRGYKIDRQALLLIAESLGVNLSKIANELDKLMLNVPQKQKISVQDVSDNIGISKEYNLFSLQKALALKDTEKLFKIIHYFKNSPKAAPLPMIIGGLYNFFNRLYLMHHFKNKRDDELQKILGLYNKYFVKEYRTATQHFSLTQTKKGIALLQEYDLKFKGVNNVNTIEPELLKEMILRMVL